MKPYINKSGDIFKKISSVRTRNHVHIPLKPEHTDASISWFAPLTMFPTSWESFSPSLSAMIFITPRPPGTFPLWLESCLFRSNVDIVWYRLCEFVFFKQFWHAFVSEKFTFNSRAEEEREKRPQTKLLSLCKNLFYYAYYLSTNCNLEKKLVFSSWNA